MSDINLGQIITDENANRDAVHVAVAAVVADEDLCPGDHAGLNSDGKAVLGRNPIGIVDPFLKVSVEKGQRFWLFLYPKTITNLRHHWTHPAFEPLKPQTSLSEQWIRNFAEHVGLDYDDLMQGAKDWVNDREYLCRGDLLEGQSVPDEFWHHFEIVTGIKGEGHFFTCSC